MNRVRVIRQLIVLLVVTGAAVFASTAAGAPPTKIEGSFSVPPHTLSLCGFDVVSSATVTFTELDLVDQSGAPTRSFFHIVEQDTFAANGKSLTSEPLTFNFDVLFDSSGNVEQIYISGIVEKVRLPDGSLFITSGRIDFTARGNPEFVLTPDHGATVNLAGFCAALSPS